MVITHEATKKAPETRTERRASEAVRTPREVYAGRKMQSTVLVPNSHASTQCGASVACTSHSGMTTFSRTWFVHIVPLKKLASIHPTLRSGPGPLGLTRDFPRPDDARAMSCGACGSRRMKTAFIRPMASVNRGIH